MTMRHKLSVLFALGLLPGLGACYSGVGDGSRPQQADDGSANDGGDDGGDDGAGDSSGSEPLEPDGDHPYSLPGDQVNLMPFHARLANLATVLEVEQDDPLLDTVKEFRYQLGDHDWANGYAADLRWSADRMQVWVRAIKPICDSNHMRSLYPDLVQDPGTLQRVAWGREPTGEDLEAMSSMMTSSQYDWATQHSLMCLTILSSLEFVGA
jgi:hypothetical protein